MKETTFEGYRARMMRVQLFIQKNLDRELGLDELAEVACFSPYHFHRIFRGMVGEPLKAYIRRLRLQRAASRLRNSTQSVIDIAMEAGYASPEPFSRAFRDMYRLPPSKFRLQVPAGGDGPSGAPRHNQFAQQGAVMDVKIVKIAPFRVAFMRYTGPYNACGSTWEALTMAMGAAGELGGGPRMLGVCYDDPEVTDPEKIRYDACIEVDPEFEPFAGIDVQTIAGGTFARTTHQGPYSGLGETYAAFFGQWLPQSGHEARSTPCLEFYLNDPESTEPEDLLTDIYMPIEA